MPSYTEGAPLLKVKRLQSYTAALSAYSKNALYKLPAVLYLHLWQTTRRPAQSSFYGLQPQSAVAMESEWAFLDGTDLVNHPIGLVAEETWTV